MCSGEYCQVHGAMPCECDVIDRHCGSKPIKRIRIAKREAELKSQLFAELEEQYPGFLVLQYLTNGAPDRTIIGVGKQTNWEFKHGTPDFETPLLQALCCARIEIKSHCRYVIWHELRGIKRTMIVRPRVIHARCIDSNRVALEAEAWCTGFDHKWLVKEIVKAHGII